MNAEQKAKAEAWERLRQQINQAVNARIGDLESRVDSLSQRVTYLIGEVEALKRKEAQRLTTSES